MKTSIGIGLRAIPPASRSTRRSSMRAATAPAYAGGHNALPPRTRGEDGQSYELRITAPDRESLRLRNIWRTTLAARLEQLERLVDDAAIDVHEAEILREQITNLRSQLL